MIADLPGEAGKNNAYIPFVLTAFALQVNPT